MTGLRATAVATALAGSRAAVASLEFGLLAPVLIVFLMGIVDLSSAIIKLRQLNEVVEEAGLMATQLSVQPDQTTTLTVAQLNQASSVLFAVIPPLANAATYNAVTHVIPIYDVTVSDIVFTPNNGGCAAGLTCSSYTANMAWSVPLQYGQQLMRPCGVVTQTSATATPTYVNNLPATIPTAGITNALTSMLVVDITYAFTPIFAKFIGPFTMRQTAFFNQRSIVVPYITYNMNNEASGGIKCPGY